MKKRDYSIISRIIEYCDKLSDFTSGMDFSVFEQSELHKDACSLEADPVYEKYRGTSLRRG